MIIDPSNGKYNASSPDEQALVEGAAAVGFKFKSRDADLNIELEFPDLSIHSYKLLNILEFNSDRKRMSVIVRDKQTNEIILYCKGADSIVEKYLTEEERESDALKETKDLIDKCAVDGLRTLLLAKKVIDEQKYQVWSKRWNEASQLIVGREDALATINSEQEVEMTLVGGTAIEDKLQDDVPDTIRYIRGAGIKLWVLTGDKIETAINIGFSCGLLENNMVRFPITATTRREIQE